MSRTVIQLEFLKVEEGTNYTVPVQENSSASDIATIIRNELHKGGIVMTEVYIDHIFGRED